MHVLAADGHRALSALTCQRENEHILSDDRLRSPLRRLLPARRARTASRACAARLRTVRILWPGVYSMAGELCPTGGTAMFAFLALAGDIGSSGGPTLIGLIAGSHGDDLSLGMLFSVVFPIILIIAAALTARLSRSARKA